MKTSMYGKARARRAGTAVAVVAVACGAAACGSSGSSGSGGNSAAASSGSSSGKTITVGMVEPISGAFALNGQMGVDGAKLAVSQINAAGGIRSMGGAKLVLKLADEGNDAPGQIAELTQQIISSDSPAAIIGMWGSGNTAAASPVAEKARVPLLADSFSNADTVDLGNPYLFKTPADATSMAQELVSSLVKTAKAENVPMHRAVLLADNSGSDARATAAAQSKEFAGYGIKTVLTDLFTPGLTSGTAIATRVVGENPSVVSLGADLPDTLILVRSLRADGYKGPIIGTGGGFTSNKYGADLGAGADGTVTSAEWNWDLPYPAVKAFDAAFLKAYPSANFPTQEAGADYNYVYILAAALEKAKSTSGAALRAALMSLDLTSGGGAIMPGGTTKFAANGLRENNIPITVQWQKGKLYTVAPSNLAGGRKMELSTS